MSHVVFMDLPLCQSLPFVIFKGIFYSSILFIPVLMSFGFLHVVILLVLGVTSDFRVVSLTFCCYVRDSRSYLHFHFSGQSSCSPWAWVGAPMTNLGFVSLIAVGPHSVLLEGVESASHAGCAAWVCRECRVLGLLWPGPPGWAAWCLLRPGPAVRGPPGSSSCPRGVWAGRAAEAPLEAEQSAPGWSPRWLNSRPAVSERGGSLRLGFRSPWIFCFFTFFVFIFY